jgi:hypothetical protein
MLIYPCSGIALHFSGASVRSTVSEPFRTGDFCNAETARAKPGRCEAEHFRHLGRCNCVGLFTGPPQSDSAGKSRIRNSGFVNDVDHAGRW